MTLGLRFALGLLLLASSGSWAEEAGNAAPAPAEGAGTTCDEESILEAAVEFFDTASKRLAKERKLNPF